MIYSEVKEFLHGYVGYQVFMSGVDLQIVWVKEYKEFLISVKNPDKEDTVDRYIPLISFEMADIRTDCPIVIRKFEDASATMDFIDSFSSVEQRNMGIRISIFDSTEVRLTVYKMDEMKNVLDLLEKLGYFDRWR